MIQEKEGRLFLEGGGGGPIFTVDYHLQILPFK